MTKDETPLEREKRLRKKDKQIAERYYQNLRKAFNREYDKNVDLLKNCAKRGKYRISISAQQITFDKISDARLNVKCLMDSGIWHLKLEEVKY